MGDITTSSSTGAITKDKEGGISSISVGVKIGHDGINV